MRKIVLASVSALALLTVAACSDTDNTTTQSIDGVEDQVPVTPAPQDVPPATAMPPAATEEAPADNGDAMAPTPAPAPAPAPAE